MLHRMCITAALVLAFGMSGIPKAESSTGESSQGCNTADAVSSLHSSLFHTPMYHFHELVHWCWKGSTITSLTSACYSEHPDKFTITYNGCTIVTDWYYDWKGSPKGGHYTMAQGSFGNCFLNLYCLNSYSPTIKIWVNAGGSWTSDPKMEGATTNANV